VGAVRLLLVEDDAALAQEIAAMLRRADFAVDHRATAEDAEAAGLIEPYDAAVLDLGLPDGDGLRVLAAWRAAGKALPVLVLTARDRFADLVSCFKAGADDYLAKPFRNEEVVLRLRALVRRGVSGAQGPVACGDLVLDAATGEIAKSGLPLRLTAFERRMLRYLMLARPRVMSRSAPADHLYEGEADRDFNSMEVIVSRLRRKIAPAVITTIRGEGYLLEPGDGG
jgi:two-component system, OmpR family, response regulator